MSAQPSLKETGARMLRGAALRAVVEALEMARDGARLAAADARTQTARLDFERLAAGYGELFDAVSASRTLVLLPEEMGGKVRQ